MSPRRKLLVALAGQPNVGKSTVFNILTGLSQHVGNWPGKTVEKKEGVYDSEETEIRIVDLPGTYSLTAFSEEEKVARDFIINNHPDGIVLITNTSALERSLYLLSELLLLGPPVIVALNMMDIANEQGIRIDVDSLEKSLGIPVVPMVATRNIGIKELVTAISTLTNGVLEFNPSVPEVTQDHKEVFDSILKMVKGHVSYPYSPRWAVTKLMEADPDVSRMLEETLPKDTWEKIGLLLRDHEDSLLSVVHGRYDWIDAIIRFSVSHIKKGQVLVTDRIDHILTRPVLGIPILLGILALIFLMTYKIGFPVQGLLERLMNSFASSIEPFLSRAPQWVNGLVIEGVIGGAGTIFTLLPILLIFFASMAFLEDVGYMARGAFVIDRFMHTIGLHGKSFIPMFFGFGCNVPAVLGARIVGSRKVKLLTILLTPFVPCTARLAVLTLVSAAVFAESAAYVTWSLVAVNILALGLTGILASKLFLKGEPMPFIMELPLYHKPNLRTIGTVVWNRIKAFVKLAGTIILGFSILIWILSNIPGGSIQDSILGRIGHLIEPLGAPMGQDWKMLVALITSFVAKENSIATLGVLYGVGKEGLRSSITGVINPASALSFLVVLMLFIPCAATSVVMKQEMGSWKWFIFSLFLMLTISFGSGIATYQVARLLGL